MITSKSDLIKIIKNIIKEKGPRADLNHIDTSFITDMSGHLWTLSLMEI